MSLLDSGGPVTVIPKVTTRGRHGTLDLTDGTPVTLQGWSIAPQSTTDGPPATYTHLASGRGPWPGGHASTVEADGITYDQTGEARISNRGVATRHVEVMLNQRRIEVR